MIKHDIELQDAHHLQPPFFHFTGKTKLIDSFLEEKKKNADFEQQVCFQDHYLLYFMLQKSV